MRARTGPSQGKAALELTEEAVHLLRSAPPAALASYYLGALPFILGLLYFWADMSRSPTAEDHLSAAALGLAILFLWLKFWQAVFAQHLRAWITAGPPPRFRLKTGWNILLAQTALQPIGVLLLPITFIAVLPFPWAYAFYQNLTTLADGESAQLRDLLKRARHQATLWPKQNYCLLLIQAGFGLVVLANCATVSFALPRLLKVLLGIESVFTRSGLNLLNTTFFAAMFGLTYLCLDPILKSVYVLRCFYGGSLESGEDLKAEVRRFALAAAVVLGITVLVAVPATGGAKISPELNAARTEWALPGQFAHASFFEVRATEAQPPFGLALASARDLPSATLQKEGPAGSLSPEELERSIGQVIQQPKYLWRMPRKESLPPGDTHPRGLRGFLQEVWTLVRDALRAGIEWLQSWLRKLVPGHRADQPSAAGGGWVLSLRVMLYLLIAAVVAALAVVLFRLWEHHSRRTSVIASQPVQPTAPVLDENEDAEQLPSEDWLRRARDWLERGQLRLAVRAFYFSSLVHLADRNLLRLAKFKSNREYEQELRRRGHSFPELLAIFGENVSSFDRVWYGWQEVNRELVERFAANVERMRTSG